MFINVLFVIMNIIIFLNGLLPFHSNNKQFNDSKQEPLAASSNKFNQTVIMIVDAMRTDFVNERFMPLTSNLIKKHGCFLNVSVASPTVTLPRIKSLITGSVPQFMDVLHNLGSPQVVEDSLLHRAKKSGSQIVFYGDDTWLKIFPKDMFLRHSGTTSFYVNDFYEVDNNVTKYVDMEQQRTDWDMMILHYLGLDHIGHVHGPFSQLVPPKLHEMDVIVSKLFHSMAKKNLSQLLILTGDHGMRDTGGHGGSTYSEAHVPFGIMGINCDDGLMDQVDITPNLSILLGLGIPTTSIGRLTKLLLKNFTSEQYLSALYVNSQLLSEKLGDSDNEFEVISRIYKSYLNSKNETVALNLMNLLTNHSEKVSRALLEASTQQNLVAMIVSVIFLCYFLISNFIENELFQTPFYNYVFNLILLVFRLLSKDYLVLVPALIALMFQLFRLSKFEIRTTSSIIIFAVFFQPITWLSSSFIEEEHEFWYFLLNTCILIQIFNQMKENNWISMVAWCSISSGFRFAETLNQMGDKWSSLPDSSDFLTKSESYHFYVILLTISILGIYGICLKSGRSIFHLEKIILFFIFIYKLSLPNNILLARIIYLLWIFYLVLGRDYLNSWVLLISLLSKPYNLCLIPLSIFTSHQILKEFKSDISSICLHIVLAKSLYFMQGTGNTIASIDVAVGYTALTNYFPVLVGLQLLIYTYSCTILMHLLLFKHLKNNNFIKILYAERLYFTIVVCIVSIIFRNHIFIWTVYAPKLCIECCHTIFLIVEFLIYVFIQSISRKINSKN